MKLEVNMAQVEPLDKNIKKSSSIPSDWEEKELREIVTLISGQHINASDYSEEPIGIPYLTGPTDFQNERIVPTKYTIKPKSCCRQNDILITVKGSGTGKTVISDGEYCISRQLMAIRTKKELTKYIYYHLKKREHNYNAESSGLIPGITREDILGSLIPLPKSEVESMKIGEIISTWDKAIELKEKLIEQKKEQKKGLMQRLLTGKVRLPGFKGEWEKVGFDEVFVKISAKQHQITTLEYLNDGNIPVVDQGKEKIVAFTNNTEKLFKVPEEGVIVFGDHTREIKYIDFDFVVGADGTQILKTKKGFYTKFYYYHLLIQKIPNTGYNRHFKFLKEMVFKRPTIEEQKAISNVLSSLDLNIDLLKQEVSFLRQQKKGLMQLLLTGKVRVKC